MGRLVKIIDDVLHVAHYRVAAPGYTLYVADATSAEGWTYYPDDVDTEDFASPWKQPVGASDAYDLGAIVSHSSGTWRSTIMANVWEPGVSGWADAGTDVPDWIQPTGAHDSYQLDAVVQHAAKSWKSTVDANVWEPGVSGWRAAVIMPPSGAPVYPDWIQPTGAHDAYQLGDLVTYNAQVWRSTINANVWAPGVFGWVVN